MERQKALRSEPNITEETILSKLAEMDLSLFTTAKHVRVSFIGHRGTLKSDEVDCFGSIQAQNMPRLQANIVKILEDKFPKLEKVNLKYYVCNALNKINDLLPIFEDEMLKKLDRSIDVSMKASKAEVVPNPIYLNLKTGLRPEFNNKQHKLEQSLPQEYQIPQSRLSELEHLNKRVIARGIPQSFKASNLKTLDDIENINKEFSERKNSWEVRYLAKSETLKSGKGGAI